MILRTINIITIALVVCALSSCSIFQSSSVYLTVEADELANNGAPIQVDVVFPNTAETQAALSGLTAKDWFEKRDQFRRDHPSEDDLICQPFEWIPGEKIHELKVKGNGAREAVVFINYSRNSMVNRLRLVAGNHIRMHFKEIEFDVIDEP